MMSSNKSAASDVQIYAIGIVDNILAGLAMGKPGRALIEELVDMTAGRAFFPESADGLKDITAKIAFELKHQYIIGYSSTNRQKDGTWRNIRVNVNQSRRMPPLHVGAKSGYFAPRR